MGDVEVRALRGVALTIDGGRVRGGDGRLRLRQEHAHEHPGLPRPSHPAATCLSRARTWPGSRATSSPTCATSRSASSSRASTCCRAPARWRTWSCPALPGRAARSERRQRAARRSRAWASATALDHTPASSPAASSSAWPSPARWSTSPRCCSPTSPPATSTRAPRVEVMALFQELNDAGHHHRPGHARARHRRARAARGDVQGRPGRSATTRCCGGASPREELRRRGAAHERSAPRCDRARARCARTSCARSSPCSASSSRWPR